VAFDGPAPSAVARHRPADARLRLGVALVLGFGFAAVDDWRLTPAILAVAGVAVGLSGIGMAALARRLRMPCGLALAIIAVLPLVAGETPLLRLGPLTVWTEGLAAAGLVTVRFLSIVAVAAAMLAPLPPLVLVRALRAVGVPALMADLALLLLRYLDEVRQEFAQMRRAMALRGRPLGWQRLPDIGWLLTALLLRAHARADRQWQAMRARGHGADRAAAAWPTPSTSDVTVLALAVLAALGLAVAGMGW
jgi:cobalt/nickel transport system permease protein